MTDTSYLFSPPDRVSVPVVGRDERFPVHRVYCLVRNHGGHAKEMGASARESPTVFLKPADPHAIIAVEPGAQRSIRYPSLTHTLHHEIELVVAIGSAGASIARERALGYVFGYASGLDMTRQDLLDAASRSGFAWCIGKSFEHSGVVSAITPAAAAGDVHQAEFSLRVNGEHRQRGRVSELIWGVAETIERVSRAWRLQPGDLIFMGTCDGVAPVVAGDVMEGGVAGLESLQIVVEPS